MNREAATSQEAQSRKRPTQEAQSRKRWGREPRPSLRNRTAYAVTLPELPQEAQSRKRWGPTPRPASRDRTAYAVTLPELPQEAQSRKRWGHVCRDSPQVEDLCHVGARTQRGAARGRSPASVRRRGISLVELLAAMAAASGVMATAMGLVHTSYRLESRARLVRADEQTALRLARQFRTDVHEARSATLPRDAAADAPLVALTGPTGGIAYRPLAQGLVRTTQPHSGPPAREEFLFSRPIAWTAAEEGSLVSLSGSSADDGRRPQLAIDVAAAIPPSVTTARADGGRP